LFIALKYDTLHVLSRGIAESLLYIVVKLTEMY